MILVEVNCLTCKNRKTNKCFGCRKQLLFDKIQIRTNYSMFDTLIKLNEYYQNDTENYETLTSFEDLNNIITGGLKNEKSENCKN